METIHISKREMKRFLVTYQGLQTKEPFIGKEGILDYFKRVGCIQFDPLNVVGRNPDLVLQSRIKNYSKNMLEELLYQDRQLIDGWDKMMAIHLATDWPYFRRLRDEKKSEIERVLTNRRSIEAIEYVDYIKDYLMEHGPSLASKIDVGRVEKGRWGHGKLSSAAMDYMFNSGLLGIKEKKNSQKVYDVIERLLDKEIYEQDDPFNSDQEYYKWAIKRRIGSIGMYWERNGGGWIGHSISNKALRQDILKQLVEEEAIATVNVEEFPKETFYIRKEDIHRLDRCQKEVKQDVKFLAPLDNLLWDRKLIKDVFDFEYSWEVYTPVVKRKYGYYVMPVLYGEELIGRFEAEMHRGDGPLVIKHWWWEEGYAPSGEVFDKIQEAFSEFCHYLNADSLDMESFAKNSFY